MTSSLWEQRLEGRLPPLTMSELYEALEAFLFSLKSLPPSEEELRSQAVFAAEDLTKLVESLPPALSLLKAQDLTLKALRLGMVRGASDGVELFGWKKDPSPATLAPKVSHGKELFLSLQKKMQQILEVARSNWSRAHPDDLYLLCEYGKHENRASLEEAARAISEGADFQKFLLASFKGGYAIGLAQAGVSYKC